MSLRWKSLLSYLLAVLFPLLLFFLLAGWSIREDSLEQKIAQLTETAALLSRLLSVSDPGLDAQVDRISANSPFRVTVVTNEGRVVADSAFSGRALAELENHSNRQEIEQSRRDGRGVSLRYSTSVKSELLYVAVPLSGRSGTVRVSVPVSRLAGSFSPLRPDLMLVMAPLLLLGAALVWVLSGRLTRSIDLLTRAAGRIAGGEPVPVIPVSGSPELEQLARSMEEMSRQRQHQLRSLESERGHLSTVLNSMGEGVLVLDVKGRILEANPSFHRMFRVNGPTTGRSSLELVRSPDLDRQIRLALKQDGQRETEIRLTHEFFLARLAPIRVDGVATGLVVVFHDITKLRRLESVRKDFVSNVSHELRTPLTSIRGYAETLLNERDLPAIHRKFLSRIEQHAGQLAEMITHLLELAKIEGAESIRREPIDFKELFGELRAEFEDAFNQKNIRFQCSNLTGRSSFSARKVYLRRVLSNLIENGLKYTPQGQVTLRAEMQNGDALFTVEDTGVGIPPEDLDRIFERFYRVDRDRSRATGGSGIGLSISRHIVQLHGGRMWAESELGKGTRIRFIIPQGTEGSGTPADSDHRG